MELKSYQKRTLRDLEDYIGVLNESNSLSAAYSAYWLGKGVDIASGSIHALKPYVNSVQGTPRVTLKVPTAGGKTFIACNAIGSIMEHLKTGEVHKAVVWFVPSDTILKQTLEKLQNPLHPYRQQIDKLFAHRVNVIDKRAALAAQGISPAQLKDNLTIFVLSAQSFIENIRVKSGGDGEMAKPLAFRENGNLLEHAIQSADNQIEGVASTALIQVLANLHPVIVVDESHNFKADLRVEMLHNLSPRFILELTATPRDNSNVISFVDAMELKVENMVKLPVIVENRRNTADVIASAIRMRGSLEQRAKAMEAKGGRYIRPIVLLQAQPKQNTDSVTFEKTKKVLEDLGIPAEQIKIKTADKDELHGVDLMARDCPVRYIVTVNALKEGWDCPFAYILASLANRTSPIDVEQILGRVLRLPHTEKHSDGLLNLSYVFTNSNDFQTTVTRIVESLMKCGFSKKDFREITHVETPQTVTSQETAPDLFSRQNLPTVPMVTSGQEREEEDFCEMTAEEREQIKVSLSSQGESATDTDTERLQQEALCQEQQYSEQIKKNQDTAINDPLSVIAPMNYNTFNRDFAEIACNMLIPMFYTRIMTDETLFTEAGEEWIPLDKAMLTEGFKLAQQNADINFNTVISEGTTIDIAQNGKDDYVPVRKNNNVALNHLRQYFVDLTAEKKKKQLAGTLSKEITNDHRLDGIPQKDIERYIANAVASYDGDDIIYLWDNLYQTKDVILDKILGLLDIHREALFNKWLETDRIEPRGHYKFIENVTFAKQELIGIDKGLYAKEETVNSFEQTVIQAVSDLDNVLFWHRNPERGGSGFCINGFINHYPDFIVRMKSGKTVMIETKGGHLDNTDTQKKIRLGNKWAAQCGPNFKYFMVFENKETEGAYTFSQLIDYLNEL